MWVIFGNEQDDYVSEKIMEKKIIVKLLVNMNKMVKWQNLLISLNDKLKTPIFFFKLLPETPP